MKAAIIGGAGYAGGELLRLLLSHPEIEVTQVTSERLGGKFVHTVHPHLRRRTELKFQSRASLQPVDVLFIALPHGETSKEIDQLQTLAPTIIDLSADFRLRDKAGYPTWYGWEHPQPALLIDFVYALPELHREQIRTANRLASGGCLATAAILGLYPLTRAGGELLRLLLSHPEIEVTQVTSERLGGKFVHTVHPHLRRRTELRFQSRTSLQPVDVLFIALPHGETSKEIDQLQTLAPTVIDLSADFRLRDKAGYPTWYGWEHPQPALLNDFVYALPELHREQIRTANRLASGGCLATAAILGLYPLTRAGVVDPSMPIVIEGKTGSSAGGAESGPASHHPHRSGEMRSFAPTAHRHTAEIIQELGLQSPNGHGPSIAFSATAVEAVRGILVTAHVFLKDDLTEKDIWKIYRAAYADEPFMRIVKESQGIHRYPNPKILSGTNYTDVGFERDPHSRRVVVMSALDNLMKGAAGQAVQALNVRFGWDERTGLDFPGLYPI